MNRRLTTIFLSAFLVAAIASFVVYRLVGKQLSNNAKKQTAQVVPGNHNLGSLLFCIVAELLAHKAVHDKAGDSGYQKCREKNGCQSSVHRNLSCFRSIRRATRSNRD